MPKSSTTKPRCVILSAAFADGPHTQAVISLANDLRVAFAKERGVAVEEVRVEIALNVKPRAPYWN